jgi:hypothetical protein
MVKLTGEVHGCPLSDFDKLPVYYNHNYHTGPLGVVDFNHITLFHPEQNLIYLIENGIIYIVCGGVIVNGEEKITEISLTTIPLEPDKATKASIVEPSDWENLYPCWSVDF